MIEFWKHSLFLEGEFYQGRLKPHMKIRVVEQRTAEPQNIQPQNFEVWNRWALSFDIQYSIFFLILV